MLIYLIYTVFKYKWKLNEVNAAAQMRVGHSKEVLQDTQGVS